MSNKIIFGADLIDVLENKYNMNKLDEVPTKYKNGVTTVDFIYGKNIDDLKYDKPYVEFSIDDETDGFISGTMYLNGGVEGIQFDSWEDLKYFMKNAKWTESKKSLRKSLKESYNEKDGDKYKIIGYKGKNETFVIYALKRTDVFDYTMTKDYVLSHFPNKECDTNDIDDSNYFVKYEGLGQLIYGYLYNNGRLEDNVISIEAVRGKKLEVTINIDEQGAKLLKNGWWSEKESTSFFGWNTCDGSFDSYWQIQDDGTAKIYLELDIYSDGKSLKESVDGYIATDEDCNMRGKCWVLDGSYNFIMDFLREWGIAPEDVKVKNGMTTLYNADGNPFGYVYQDEEVDIFVADKTTNWTWENHNPSTKRVKVIALDEIF